MKILGTGCASPSLAVTNKMLEEFLDTSDEWITERTGIKERRVMTSEHLLDLAVEAARKAIDDAGMTAADLDYIICSNVVNEYSTPALSCLIQGAIGATCPCLDINAACAGFIFALDMAEDKLRAGKAENILIVCAEEPTRMVDWNDRNTCVLFGDGAGAAVVGRGEAMKTIRLTTSSRKEVLYQVRRLEPTPYLEGEREFAPLVMKGRDVFKTAVSSSTADIKAMLAETGISPEQVKYYVLHQANERIIDSIRGLLGEQPEKFPHNVERYGNTSSASVPILLDEMSRAGKLSKGDIIVMSAFGAGFTTAGCILEWTK